MLKTKRDAISAGQSFKLFWYNEEAYCEYNLVFTGMPIVALETENFDNDSDEVWGGSIKVYDPYRTSLEYQMFDCTFNIRGGTSVLLPKKGYKVELEKKGSLLGMRSDDDWIFNALYDDAGLVHNKASMEVWEDITEYNSVNGDGGFDCEYAEVFINGSYNGVYLIGERVDEKELQLNEKDVLYKCRAMRIPEEHNYTNEDTDDLRPIFLLKYPQEDVAENWKPIKMWVDYFLKLKVESYEEAVKIIDMENAIDYNIFTLLTGAGDNRRKNTFFTAEYQEDGTYRFVKNPWDLNATWGNLFTGNSEENNTLFQEDYYREVRNWSSDVSTLYYMNEKEISRLLYARWIELRNTKVITEEGIDEIFNSEYAYLYASGAYVRNYERWPNGTQYWDDNYVFEYVEKRIPFLDQYFEELYFSSLNGSFYDGIDYSNEFEVRYYWEKYYDILSEIYEYDKNDLLEHYHYYGRPYGMQGRPADWSQIPVTED